MEMYDSAPATHLEPMTAARKRLPRRFSQLALVLICAVMGLLFLFGLISPIASLNVPVLETSMVIRYVAQNGSATSNCTDTNNPCSLERAMAVVLDGDEVRVAGGAPYSDINIQITQTISLLGGYISPTWATPDPVLNPTILDGGGAGPVIQISHDISPVVEGFHIRNGSASEGGGIQIETDGGNAGTGNPTIRSNEIYNNAAGITGGGISVGTARATIENNDIHDNQAEAGGGIFLFFDTGQTTPINILFNHIYDNHADSGTAQDGGGIYVNNTAVAFIEGNVIHGNTAGEGGGIFIRNSGSATVQNNIMYLNDASTNGGGIHVLGTLQSFQNTLAANNANSSGGGINIGGSATTQISNTIVTSNTAGVGESGINSAGGSVSGGYNNLFANSSNVPLPPQLSSPPGFINYSIFNLHLSQTSLNIDAGDPQTSPLITQDFERQARPNPDTLAYDIGADEFYANVPDFSFTPAFTEEFVDRGTLNAYQHDLVNLNTTDPDTYTFNCTNDQGWSVLCPLSVTLPVGGFISVTTQISVPGTATALTAGSTRITATSTVSPLLSQAVAVRNIVNPNPDLTFTPNLSATAPPGEAITLTHRLTNTGDAPDTFVITIASDPFSWASLIPSEPLLIPLGINATTDVRVRIDVPANAASFPNDIVLQAASGFDPGVTGLVTDTIRALETVGTRYVSDRSGASDFNNNCTQSNTPCRTILHAIQQAVTGDEIRIAEGNYTVDVVGGIPINETFFISGGWSQNYQNPDAGETIISPDSGTPTLIFDLTGAANNSTFHNLTLKDGQRAAARGGAISVGSGVQAFFTDVSILSSQAERGGAVHISAGALAQFDRSHFISNTATFQGGAFHIEGGTLIVRQSTFQENDAVDHGGALYSDGGLIISENNLFNANISGNHGGAFYLNDSSTSMNHNTVVGNNASNDGGGLYVNNTSEPVSFVNGLLVSNIAGNTGGGILVNSGSVTGNFVDVWNNSAVELVGSISFNNVFNTDPLFIDSEFRLAPTSPIVDARPRDIPPLSEELFIDFEDDGRPSDQGFDLGYDELAGCAARREGIVYGSIQEAIEADGATAELIQVSGICRGVHDLSVGGTTIQQSVHITGSQNFVIQGGWDSQFNDRLVEQVTIVDPQNGGRGFYISGSVTVTLEYLTLRNGDAAGLSGGPNDEDAGGLIYNNGSDVRLRGVSLLTGTASLGGGYYHVGGTTQIGLLVAEEPDFNLPGNINEVPLRSRLQTNTATAGGAIYVFSDTLTIDATDVFTNQAANGAGIYNDSGLLTATNTILAFNSATGSGGGFYNNSLLTSTLYHLTVVSNTAVVNGGGLFAVAGTSVLTVNSSIFQGNNAAGGDAVFADGAAQLDYNYHYNQNDPVAGGAATGTNSIIGAIAPGLIAPGAGDFHLQNTAPAVDVGNPASPVRRDMDDDPRPSNQSTDIGADEIVGCLVNLNGTIYGSIQAAMTDAVTGDLIQVSGICSGVHDYDTGDPAGGGCRGENGIIQTNVHIDKNVTLQGGWDENFQAQGDEVTILDATGLGRVIYIAPGITATVEGFSIVNGLLGGSNGNGAGICVDNAAPTIRHNHIITNTATNGGAIYTINSGGVIESSRIFNNTAADGAGIYLNSTDGTAVSLWNNFIYSNTASTNGGAIYSAIGDHRLWHNTIVANEVAPAGNEGGAIFVGNSGPEIRNSIFLDNDAPNTDGIFGAPGSAPLVTYDNFFGHVTNLGGTAGNNAANLSNLDPLFSTSSFTLTFASPMVDIGDAAMTLTVDFQDDLRMSHQGFDLGADEIGGCFARITSDPNTIYGSAQLAVDLAASGSVVQVDGICKNVNTRSNSGAVDVTQNLFLDKSLTIDGNWNSGLTNNNITTTLHALDRGRSVYIDSGVVVTLTNIRLFHGDSLNPSVGINNHGGGIYNSGTLNLSENAEVTNNTAANGGGIYNTATLNLLGGTIIANTADNGGGLYNNSPGAAAVISESSRIRGNTALIGNGGGIYQSNGDLLVDSSRLFGNSAPQGSGGAFYLAGGTANGIDLRNNFIYGNSALNGGGLFNQDSDAQIWHNTFFQNEATNPAADGGGIYNTNTAVPTVRSNIIDSSIGSGLHVDNGGSVDNDYNNVVNNLANGTPANYSGDSGNGPGANDVPPNQSPLYEDALVGDFHLLRLSPGVDVADPNVPFTYDIDGHIRPTNGGPDTGADEVNTCLIRVVDPTDGQAHIFGVFQDAIDFAEGLPLSDDNLPPVEVARGECTGVKPDINNSSLLQVGSIRRDLVFEGSLRRTDFQYVGDYTSDDVGTVSSVINAETDGRVLYIHNGADPRFVHLAFVGGDAANGGSANLGGAIYVPGSGSLRMETSFACNSDANTGGGVYLSNSSSGSGIVSDFTGVTIGACWTADVTETPSGSIENVIYVNHAGNQAFINGGGMFSDGPFDMRNIGFMENIAAQRGGGLYQAENNNRIINGIFYSNTANLDGGGLFNTGAGVHLYHNTFRDNRTLNGNGGGIRSESSGFILNSSIVYSNTAPNGSGGGLSMPNPPSEPAHTLTYNNFYDNVPDDTDTTTGVGSNAINGDPDLFYIYPSRYSPAIDEADPTLLTVGVPPDNLQITFDADNVIRPDGGTDHRGTRASDLGAFEWWKDFGCLVTPGSQQATVVPGNSVIYNFVMENTGFPYPPSQFRHGFTDTITVTLLTGGSSQDWGSLAGGDEQTFTLDWLETVPLTLTVNVPITASNGDIDISTIECQSYKKPERIRTATANTNVGLVSGLLVYPNYFDSMAPGEIKVYTHTVENIGNDTIDVVIVPDAGMDLANATLLYDSGSGLTDTIAITTTLARNETFEVLLEVTIFNTAPRGEFARPGVVATEVGQASNQGAVQNEILIVGASGPRYVVAVGGDDVGNNCMDPTQPCDTINHAIDAAEPDDTIFLGDGDYTNSITRTINSEEFDQNIYIDKSVTIEGGYTSLDDFQTQHPITQAARIDGEGLRRAIYVEPGISVTLSSLFILNGRSLSTGDLDFGGNIYNAGAQLTISGTWVLSGNAKFGGGLYHISNTLHVKNSVLAHNTDDNPQQLSGDGGGIFLESGELVIENSTLVNNMANTGDTPAGSGGAIFLNAGTLTSRNNIFSDNFSSLASAVFLNTPATLNASDYNLYWQNVGAISPTNFITGSNSFSGNPSFLDEFFHIGPTSAAKDTGTTGTILPNPVDFDLEPRVMGADIDIGADERFQRASFTFTPITNTAVITTGEIFTYEHTLVNTGDTVLSHTITMVNQSVPPGGNWNHLLNPTAVTNLLPGERVTVSLAISGTNPGYQDLTAITAATTNLAEPISETVYLTTTVTFTPGVAVGVSEMGIGLPGLPTSYGHVLTNTGNGADQFTITVTDVITPGPGWLISITPTQTGYLAAAATLPFTVTVTPPLTALPGAVHTVTVEASSNNSLGIDARDALTDTTFITSTRSLILVPAAITQTVPDSTTAVFTHTLRNTGNISDSVSLSVSGVPASWPVSVNPSTVLLQAGAGVSITVDVIVPANAGGMVHTATVSAVSDNDSNVTASALDTTIVQSAYSVQIGPDLTQTALAPTTVFYTHTVTNTGNISDSYVITAQSSLTWTTAVTPSLVTLDPGLTATVLLTVAMPANAQPDFPNTTTITATSHVDSAVFDTAVDVTQVQQVHDLIFIPDRARTVDTGQAVTYTHWLTNTGNGSDSFALTAVSENSWSTETPAQTIDLGPGIGTSVVVTLNVPSGAAGFSDVMTVTAASTISPSLSAAVFDTTTVSGSLGILGVLIEPDRAASGDPGDTLTYLHTVTNTGNITDDYSLNVTSQNGWLTGVMPAVHQLAPLANTQVMVTVTIPLTAPNNSSDLATVTVASQTDMNIADTAADTTTVGVVVGVDIEPDRTGTANAGDIVTYTHTVTNTGNDTDTFTITTNSSEGWNTPDPAAVTLDPGLSTSIVVTLEIPAAVPDSTDMMSVVATSASNPAISDSVLDTTTVTGVSGTLGVVIEPDNSDTGLAGTVVQYQHVLTNSGTVTDDYQISAVSSQGWSIITTPGSSDVIRLGPGQSSSVLVRITIPAAATAGTVDVTTVTAVSLSDGTVSDTATDTTTVTTGELNIYLPIILNQIDSTPPPNPTATPVPTTTATPTPVPPGPTPTPCAPPTGVDLIVTQIQVVPSTPVAGEPATVLVTIRNQGSSDVTFGNNFFTDFYVDRTPLPFVVGDIVWGVQGADMGAGDNLTLSAPFTFNAGSHNLWAQVDTDQHVNECPQENNNTLGPVNLIVSGSEIEFDIEIGDDIPSGSRSTPTPAAPETLGTPASPLVTRTAAATLGPPLGNQSTQTPTPQGPAPTRE